MAEVTTLKDAIATLVHDGDSVALEGFTHLIPFAAGHEIVRQGRKRPRADPDDAGPDLRPDDRDGLRAQAGVLVRRQPGRRARCTGCATRSRRAGRCRWSSRSTRTPAWPTATPPARRGCRSRSSRATRGPTSCRTRGSRRSSARSPARSSTPCRRCGRTSTIVHAQRADRKGNVQLWGILGIQKEAALAADRALVTVEEIVDELEPRPGAIVIPTWAITAVAEAPRGASPVLRPLLLRPRQRLLQGLGRDRARPRRVQGVDGGARPVEHSADEMMTVAAARELRDGEVVLRRHRAAEHRGQPRPRPPRARRRAHLRVRHDRLQADAAAALDRRRRPGRDRRRGRAGAGDLQLLAAGRPDRRRLPRRRADRPPGQPELDGHRRLRRAEGAAAGRRRRAGDRRADQARDHDHPPVRRARSSTSSTSRRRSAPTTRS